MEAVSLLFEAEYGKPKDRAELRWRTAGHLALPEFKHVDRPSGFVAVIHGEIVAFQGYYLHSAALRTEPVVLAESLSTLVIKEWRGKDVYARLNHFAEVSLARMQIALVMGVPSGPMIKAMSRNGFHTVGTLRLFERHVRPAEWVGWRPRFPAAPNQPLPEEDTIFLLARSAEATRSRYDDRPGVDYTRVSTPFGSGIYRFKGRSRRYVTICNLQVEEGFAARFDLAACVTGRLSRFPRRVISCWAVDASPLASTLVDLGYAPIPEGKFPIMMKGLQNQMPADFDSLIPDMMIGDFDIG